jgi:uncharacterized protein with HEPN domain
MSMGIIGEAASHVSVEFRDTHPEIPWRQIVGMRNFLIHVYFNVELDIVWSTAIQSVPALIVELQKLISPDSYE